MKLNRLILFPLLYILGVYSLLPVVRIPTDFLRANNLLSVSVTGTYTLAFIAIVYMLAFRLQIRSWVTWAGFILIGLAYVFSIVQLEIPEERLHFIQYGPFGYLVCRALAPSLGGWRLLWGALIIIAPFCLLDEVIQHFLPRRYFNWLDVAYNLVGAYLAVFLFFLLRMDLRSKTSGLTSSHST